MRPGVNELDVRLADGRTLHAYDTGTPGDQAALTVVWHHGTPNIGAPPEPLLPMSEQLGIRWISYDRPGYGGSTRLTRPRCVIGRRVRRGGPATLWESTASRRWATPVGARMRSRPVPCCPTGSPRWCAWPRWRRSTPMGSTSSTPCQHPAWPRFARRWRGRRPRNDSRRPAPSTTRSSRPRTRKRSRATGRGSSTWCVPRSRPDPRAGSDDDLAYVAPWGFDPADVSAPTLLLHGGRDRTAPIAHAEWLARRCPSAELRLFPDRRAHLRAALRSSGAGVAARPRWVALSP